MPITQARMAALIRAAQESNDARRALIGEFSQILEQVLSTRIDGFVARAMLANALASFAPSEDSIIALAREQEHFKHTSVRNLREREKARARRRGREVAPRGEASQKIWGLSPEEGDRAAQGPLDREALRKAEQELRAELEQSFARSTPERGTPQGGAARSELRIGTEFKTIKGEVEYDAGGKEDEEDF